MRHACLLLSLLLLLGACRGGGASGVRSQADSLNARAYAWRYKQTDTVRHLAQEAYRHAQDVRYTDGMAEALNLMMFERFQQMDFDSVVALGRQLEQLTPSPLEELFCSIMQMKVDQRTSDNRSFFVHRAHALHCLEALQGRERRLTDRDRRRLRAAQSELHIVASTYFYYVDQRERALDEILQAEAFCILPEDTAQWLNYCYMRGSGGLATATEPEAVTCQEFDYLMQCFTIARYQGYTYFEANSSQALATMFADTIQRRTLDEQRPDIVHYLTGIFGTDSTAVRMAERALMLFREYDDLYQTACALRTLGELAFDAGEYAEAITFYTSALNCVNFHHDLYYAADQLLEPGTSGLLPFDPEAGDESVERRWLRQEGVRTVPEWIAGIRQQLSVAYSALNMKATSDFNRNIYLDLLDVTREDAELESRAAELHAESHRLHRLLVAVGCTAALVVLLSVLLFRAWRRRGEAETRRLRRRYEHLLHEAEERSATLADAQEQLHEQQLATDLRIQRDKRLNVEKRAKLSLVHGIVPFLDRIIHEVRRMKRAGETNPRSLAYIGELLQPIAEYNDLLTEWIRVEQGQLSLQLSSFELEPLFASMRQSHFAYEQKGLTLSVEPTDLAVKADRALTLFMLNTLADNARKFTPAGGRVTVRATVSPADAEAPYVELSVQDTGCGLSPADVNLILNNKVYDAAAIGTSGDEASLTRETAPRIQPSAAQGQKGFGFGLMNCKGIIEKYRKTSPAFRVCTFGIESRVGQGSRFFFRLPRVLMALGLLLVLPAHLIAATPPRAYQLMDSVYYSNVQGRYVDALSFADSVVDELNAMGLDGRIELRPGTDAVAEVLWWQRQEDVDYSLLLGLRNEVAVAALALHDWTLYRKNNSAYKRLYKLVGQDPTLEAYCQQTERTQTHERLALVAVILLLVAGIAVVYVFWFRPLLARRKAAARLNALRLEQLRAEHEAEHQRSQEDIELAEDEHRRRLYEEERLHVQNQIIDNCLSTIKHETMYYPGRIQQLVEKMQAATKDAPPLLTTLSETVAYYKDIFTLLSAQADAQSAAVGFRRGRLTFAQLVGTLPARFAAKARRQGLPATLLVEDHSADALVVADPDLVQVLLDSLLDYELHLLTSHHSAPPTPHSEPRTPHSAPLTLRGTPDGRFLRCSLACPSVPLTSEELHTLFMPHRGGIPLLLAKQVIREHDTFMGHPGCRIQADALAPGGHILWFTLPLATTPEHP